MLLWNISILLDGRKKQKLEREDEFKRLVVVRLHACGGAARIDLTEVPG